MAEKTIATTEQKDEALQEQTRETERYLTPPVDIYETGDELVLVADVPGVGDDQLSINVDRDILTIQARSQDDPSAQPVDREFQLMSYYRQFQLSNRIDQDKISAELTHGVLTLHLPKAEEAKPRQIAVQTS
jgi:HSP20 family molecular chaperone IbpA